MSNLALFAERQGFTDLVADINLGERQGAPGGTELRGPGQVREPFRRRHDVHAHAGCRPTDPARRSVTAIPDAEPRRRRWFPYAASVRHEVTEVDTAAALGSGDVPVLATPRLIAWMEAATAQAAADHLQTGQTSVGTAIRNEHRLATPMGGIVETAATLASPAGAARRLTFTVQATNAAGQIVAAGEIDRAIVDRDHFLATVTNPDAGH